MKCVVTRDEGLCGCIDFWPLEASIEKADDGIWGSMNKNSLATVSSTCVRSVCKLLGFTPRKGSKQVVEITVKKIK